MSVFIKSSNVAREVAVLTSKHWGKGITTEAFKKILVIAKRNKIKYVSCTISKNNKSSLGIWQTYCARIKRNKDNIIPFIKLR